MLELKSFDNIVFQGGSSSLIGKGVIPISTQEGVETLSGTFPDVDQWIGFILPHVSQTQTPEGAEQITSYLKNFYSTYSELRIKKGAYKNPKAFVSIFDMPPNVAVRAPKEQSAPKTPREPRESGNDEPRVVTPPKVDKLNDTYIITPGVPQPAHIITSSLAMLHGVSATGKGTRFSTLMMFLIDSGYKYDIENVIIEKDGVKKKMTSGFFFPDLNIFFVAKWVKSNLSKLISLTGADAYTGSGMFHQLLELVKQNNTRNVILEGYVAMFSGQWTTKYAHETLGFNNFFKQYLTFDTKEQMLERIVGRSIRQPKGDSAWRQNGLAKKMYVSETAEAAALTGQLGKTVYEDLRFDVPISEFGAKYLEFLGWTNLVEPFKQYVLDGKHTGRHYSDLENNNLRFEHLVEAQYKSMNEQESFNFIKLSEDHPHG